MPRGAEPAAPGLAGRILAVAMGAVMLVLALMFSLLLFVAVVAGAALVWGYLWWKTRGLRRQMREQSAGGRVFEGEVIREPAPAAATPRILQRPED